MTKGTDLPKGGLYGPGQDFQAQRRKAQAGSLVPAPKQADTIKGGPSPMSLYGSRQVVPVAQIVRGKDVSKQPASNQDKYGANREKIRQIIKNWGRP
jgi:hypothetical protein